jgi:hypothetical protein
MPSPGPLGRFVQHIRDWLESRLPEAYVIRGIRVVVENTRPDIRTSDVLSRLDEALGLIERYQPWRLAHLRRDLAEIRVMRYPCRGAYFPDERVCMTELTFLARRDITAAPVASSIIHEGMHARVSRMNARLGGQWQYAKDRAREERLCRKAEVAFGRALPPALGAPVVERALACLASADEEIAPSIDWSVAHARQELADLEASPLPAAVKQQLIDERRAIIEAHERSQR